MKKILFPLLCCAAFAACGAADLSEKRMPPDRAGFEKSKPEAQPEPNALVVNGKPFSGVRTVTEGKHILLPLAQLVKDADGGWFLPPWEYALKDRTLAICGYDFALPVEPGPDKLVPAELVGVLLGMTAHSDEATGCVRFLPRRDHSGILHVSASSEAEALRDRLYNGRSMWVTLGRDVTAEIVFVNARELAGVEFELPYGETHRQRLRIDLVSGDGKAETVFDGATDGSSTTARIDFPARSVRAVRLCMKGNGDNAWNNVGDIRFLPPEDQRVSDPEILRARPILLANLRKLLAEDAAAPLTVTDVRYAGEAVDLLRDFQADGTWRDIDYGHRGRGDWKPRVHLLRMKALALAHPERAKKALRAWVARDPRSPNWWHTCIGTPEALCQTLILLGGIKAVDPATAVGARAIIERSFEAHPKVGQNLVWLSGIRLMAGLLWDDPGAIRTGSMTIRNELCLVPIGGEGLQADWSFHQHGIQLQIGNYGLEFLRDQIWWMRVLAGTPLAYPAEKTALLDHYLMDCLRWTVWDGAMEPSACGRMVLREGMEQRYATVFREARALAPLLPPDRRAAVLAWLDAPEKLVGAAAFPLSGYLIYRAPAGWNFSLKMDSPELVNSETVNGQNLRALYQADGAVFFGDLARYRDFHVLCDAHRLPGTTELQDGRSLLGQVAPRNVGGAYAVLADFPVAAAAMRFAPGDLTADKVWFCTPSGVWCSGSDIGSAAKAPVVTTVDQYRAEGSPLAADVPAGFPAVVTQTLDMTGDLHLVMRESPSREMTGKMTLMTIDHGVAPSGAVYRYRMRRPDDPVKPETWLASSSPRIHALLAEDRVLIAAFVAGEVTLPDGGRIAVRPGLAVCDAQGQERRRADFRVK